MNSSSVPALALHPRSASRPSWRRRICRGDATTSEPSSQARPHGTIAVPWSHGTERRVHVHGQQVVAALGPMLGDLLDEVPGGQSLALQAALRVAQGDQHRVDLAGFDPAAELLEPHPTIPLAISCWEAAARTLAASWRAPWRPLGGAKV
jgi:hypothetical protein